jgi:hypothetical protein
MANRKDNPELMAELLGYHMGLVDAQTRARVEGEFSAEELAKARAAVKKLLSPLETEAAPQPPPDLVSKIMGRVAAVNATLPLKKPAIRMTPASERSGTGRPLMRLRELVGLAAAIALFLGVFMPGYRTARQASQQAMCANNQREIGQAYGAYAAQFGDQMPYVAGPMPPDATWRRTGAPGVLRATNSRHPFQLVVGKLVSPRAFVCQSRAGDHEMSDGPLDSLETFPDPRNNSYATNIVTKPVSRRDLESTDPLLGDMNPLAETPASPVNARDLPANSRSHGGATGGQNVLYADFSVRFVRNPNVGIENDDIYRLIGVQEYTGRERPTLRSDAFLIP